MTRLKWQHIRERYSRLSLWNKLGAWGALASILSVALYFWPLNTSGGPSARVSGSQNTTVIQSGRDTVIYPPAPAPGGVATGQSGSAPTAIPRTFTLRSVRELLALYEGRTMLQADALIEPYKGMWISVTAAAIQIIPDGGGVTVVLRKGTDLVNARCDLAWRKRLARVNSGETITVRGRLNDVQNGQQLYLVDCEIGE